MKVFLIFIALIIHSYSLSNSIFFKNKLDLKNHKPSILNISQSTNNSYLDISFGINGIQLTDFKKILKCGSNQLASSIVIKQTNGQIIAGGYSNAVNPFFDFALAKYKSNGSLDTSFGTSGVVLTNIGTVLGVTSSNTSFINSIVLQPDGKIVAGGFYSTYTASPKTLFALARYMPDGQLDTSFGANGIVITDVGQKALSINNTASIINSITLQSDGKIVAGGISGAITPDGSFAIARYNIDGTLDNSFGTNGCVVTSFSQVLGLALQSIDGINGISVDSTDNIIAAGFSTATNPQGSFAIAKYESNGTLDTSFNSTGLVLTDFSPNSNSIITSITIQTDDKIVVGGLTTVLTGNPHFALARYNINGTLDNSFNGTGKVETIIVSPTAISFIKSITLQSDGKIIAGGVVNFNIPENNLNNFVIARYETNGILDPSFSGGIVITQIPSIRNPGFGSISQIYGIAINNSNDDIIAGGLSDAKNINDDFTLAKYNSSGKIYNNFGTNSFVFTDFQTVLKIKAGSENSINSIALQSDGSIITTGFSDVIDPNYDFSTAKYKPDGTLDKTFGTKGITAYDFSSILGTRTTFLGTQDVIFSNAVLKDDSIINAGFSNAIFNSNSFALLKMSKNGILDSSFGTKGIVVTNIGNTISTGISTDQINNIAIQADGKIIAGGFSTAVSTGGNLVLT